MKQHVVYQLLLIYENLAVKQSTREINISACGRTCKLVIPDNIPQITAVLTKSECARWATVFIHIAAYSTHRDKKPSATQDNGAGSSLIMISISIYGLVQTIRKDL